MKKSTLLKALSDQTARFIQQANVFSKYSDEQLNWKAHPDSWSILECLEHLNLYGDFYLKELEHRIMQAKKSSADHSFRSGWFGEKTVSDMLPKNDRVRKMKTFQSKDPSNSQLSRTVINRFIKQQQQMLVLLKAASHVNISQIKTKITLPVIRFKLGTTLRFVVNHNERHLWQAKNVAAAQRLT